MTQRTYPLTFRPEETAFVMQCWSAGVSCSLVGVGSVGKSNLLKHIVSQEVQRHYRGPDATLYIPVIIDANLMIPLAADASEPLRCWAGYELLMHRLYTTLHPFDTIPQETAERFYDLYQLLHDGTNPLYVSMGLRYFELGLTLLIEQGLQFVFLLDECEEFLLHLPPKFFQTLRGIRDMHKRSLLFLTFSRAPLPILVERMGINPAAAEAFLELLTDHVYYVGPYNEADGSAMLQEWLSREKREVSLNTRQQIEQVTGRYAGLLRAVISILDTPPPLEWQTSTLDQLCKALLMRQVVLTECRTLWASLTPPEQYVLKAVVRLVAYQSTPETEQIVALLIQKRLLRLDKHQQRLDIMPPLFNAYVLMNPD
ncbi:MAG: hypothetical protein SF162_04515 [bacterium]|nr:hypothetical protein [bacterium]